MHHLHYALIVSHLCEHNHKQNYWYYENIHLFIIKLHAALHSLNIEKGKNARCFRDVWWSAVIHGSARRNRTFHCSVCSEYLTFYCRNIIAEHIRWLVKYSQVGAILWTRISSSGANSVAPLCGLTETAVWCHCLRPKKVPFGTFRR